MSETVKIGRHSLFVLLEKIGSIILSFILMMLLTRKLGPENYGIFSYLISIFSFLIPFSTLGLESFVSRNVPFYIGRKEFPMVNRVIIDVLKLSLLLTTLISLILFLFHGRMSYGQLLLYLIPYLVLMISLEMGFAIMGGLREMGLRGAFILLWRIITLSLIFVLINKAVMGAIISYQLGLLIPTIIVFIYIYYKSIAKHPIAPPLKLKNIFSFSLPYFIGGIAASIFTYISVFYLKFFSFKFGIEEIGYYSLAFGIIMPLVNLINFIPEAVSPGIIQFYGEQNQNKVNNAFKLSWTYTLIFIFPLIISIISTSDIVILKIFKSDYIAAAPILQILAIALTFSMMIRLLLPIIWARNDTKDYMWMSIMMVILILPLIFILIPWLGAIGAAWARVIAMGIITIYFTIRVIRKSGLVLPIRNILKALIFSLIFFVLIILPRKIFLLAVVWLALAALYFGLLFFTKVLSKGDIDNFFSIIKMGKSPLLDKNP